MKLVGWFLTNFTSEDISIVQIILILGLACINAVYIFCVYRILGRKTIYTKRYSIAISAILVVTTAIIFTTYESATLSLGVIGALAIIRFRTAIKDSLDLVYLFWAVTVGICYGSCMEEIAIVLSATLTMLIFYLDGISVKHNYRILILESENFNCEREIVTQLKLWVKKYRIKSTETKGDYRKTVIEVKTKQEYQLVKELMQIAGVRAVSLIAHDNEHCY